MLSTRFLSRTSLIGRSSLARQLAGVTAVVAVTFSAACSGDLSTSPDKPVPLPGAYPMTAARGLAVPHTFTDAVGKKLTIQGGALTMTADGKYMLNYAGKLNAITFDLTDEGSFSQAGANVTFTPDDGDPAFVGRIVGKSLVIDDFKIARAARDPPARGSHRASSPPTYPSWSGMPRPRPPGQAPPSRRRAPRSR
jgi:hypothetical protein